MSDKKTNIVFLLAFAFFLCLPKAFAQDISIESFRLLENDLTANLKGSMRVDHNGETAALLKIVTAEQGFSFDGGMVGIVDTKQEVGEIWVWVPHGIKKISIRHPQLGVLRDYYFSIPIEKAKTYEMRLVSGQVKMVTNVNVNQQFVVFQVYPVDAKIEINDEILVVDEHGKAEKRLEYGNYQYRVSCTNYHTQAGVFELKPENKTSLQIELQPNFGWINISADEDFHDAYIYINNERIGQVPMQTEALRSGNYHLSVIKPMYKNFEQHVVVRDNDTLKINVEMQPNFAKVIFQVSPQTEVWINDEYKGIGRTEAKLELGEYKLETRRASHESSSQLIQISSPIAQTIVLREPIPLYGSVSVQSEPSESKIFLDNEYLGESPMILNSILVGNHFLRFEKDGYAPKTMIINVEHNKTVTADTCLSKEVNIRFDKNGGIGEMAPFKMSVGIEASLPTNMFTKKNYSFRNWNTQPDGSGDSYSNRQTININQDITLYAQWEDQYVEANFTSDPSGAKLYIDGKYIGHTPYFTAMEVGKYNVSMTAKNHYPIKKHIEVHADKNDFDFKLKRQYFMPNELYLGASYDLTSLHGIRAHMGFYIKNFNIEANAMKTLHSSEKIYWNIPSEMTKPSVYVYEPLYIGGRFGYSFIIASKLRITPQVGSGLLQIKGHLVEVGTRDPHATDAYCVPAEIGIQLDYAIAPCVAVSVNPKYYYPIVKSKLYQQLSVVSENISSYVSGFSASAGVCLFF